MIKTGKIKLGSTPCFKCGATSIAIEKEEAVCHNHKRVKKEETKD